MSYEAGIIIIESLGWQITLIDAIVALFALIMAFVGLAKGFTKIFFSLIGTLAVIVGAVLLAGTVGGWLTGPFGHFVSEPTANWLAQIDAEQEIHIFSQVIDWTVAENRSQYIPLVLSAMGLPATLSGIITDTGLFNSLFEGFGEAALIDVLPGAVASLAMTIIAFVLLIIVLTIVVIIIRRLVERLMSFALLGGINRVLGFVIGLAEAYLIISILLTVVAYLPSEGFMSAIYQQIDASTITKFLVEHNWIGNWLLTTIF